MFKVNGIHLQSIFFPQKPTTTNLVDAFKRPVSKMLIKWLITANLVPEK